MGMGRQSLGARINVVTLWLVGLPLASGLSIGLGVGAPGLWVAMAGA